MIPVWQIDTAVVKSFLHVTQTGWRWRANAFEQAENPFRTPSKQGGCFMAGQGRVPRTLGGQHPKPHKAQSNLRMNSLRERDARAAGADRARLGHLLAWCGYS